MFRYRKAEEHKITVGEDAVLALMFADGFLGISEAPEGLQTLVEKALAYR